MNLCKILNSKCPKVSHYHGMNLKKQRIIPNCLICNPNNYLYHIPICPKNSNYSIITISNELKKCIYECLLPKLNTDVIKIIINFLNEKYYFLNLNNINHFINCYKCSPIFIKYIDENSCGFHYLPRLKIE
jgi:hypothetical protein